MRRGKGVGAAEYIFHEKSLKAKNNGYILYNNKTVKPPFHMHAEVLCYSKCVAEIQGRWGEDNKREKY